MKPPDIDLPVYKTVKHSLRAILKNPEETHKRILSAVLTGHKLVQHASQFIKLYFIHCYDHEKPFPVLDTKFVKCVMKTIGVKDTKQGRPPNADTVALMDMLQAFHDVYYATYLHENITFSSLDNMLTYLADGMVTVLETNIKQHFVEYVERFVNVAMDKKGCLENLKTKEEKQEFVSSLRRYKVCLLERRNQELPEQLLPHASFVVPQRPFQKNSLRYDIVCSPQDYLPSMFYMMRFVEAKDQTIYNVFPIRSEIIPKYVPLDTATIAMLLLKDGACVNGISKGYLLKNGNMKANEDAIWASFFRTELRCFRKKHYQFDHRILTDGEGVSILLIRRGHDGKKARVKDSQEAYMDDLTPQERVVYQQKRKVAIDPNMDDIVFCSGENLKGEMEHFRYTRNQRRKETKNKKYRKIHEELKKTTVIEDKTVQQWETELSKHNKKTLSFDRFLAYVKDKNAITQKLMVFYQQRIFRQLKWYGFINRQKTEARMVRRFRSIYGSPSETVIYIGDWEQYKHRKYKEPSIGKGIRNVFRRAGYQVLLIDEFRTSCRCYKCHGLCETFRKCPNPKPWKCEETTTRHGLLMCQTCSGLWNRDVNSSLNILRIVEDTLAEKGRPEYLRREKKQDGGATSATGGEKIPVKQGRKPKLSHTPKLSRGCEASTLEVQNPQLGAF
jgi:transposase